MRQPGPLAIVDTHPVQYRAPVYQTLARDLGIPITVIYGSDFSVAGYRDREFGASFSWDTDLLSDTNAKFIGRVEEGGADSFENLTPRGLGRAIAESGASGVLATGYRPMFNLAAVLQARLHRIPVLFRAETADVFSKRGGALRRTGLRALYSLCDRVLPIGSSSRAHYRRLGVPESKMIFSPYCVNTTPFRCEERDREVLREPLRREWGLAPGDAAVLFSGKLSERKGVHTLVEAVKRLPAARRSAIVLVFLGTGAEQESLERACAAGPGVRAIFPGFRNQKELSPYFHAADVFVLPSLWGETWGLVVNEALHHGLPAVVSAAVGCAPDLIEGGVTGAVADTGSAGSLAGAIETVLMFAGEPETRAWCRQKVSGYSTLAAASGIARAWFEITGWSGMTELVTRGTAA
jgi:glycosyltransferase involved in cell wall biosynthesis